MPSFGFQKRLFTCTLCRFSAWGRVVGAFEREELPGGWTRLKATGEPVCDFQMQPGHPSLANAIKRKQPILMMGYLADRYRKEGVPSYPFDGTDPHLGDE